MSARKIFIAQELENDPHREKLVTRLVEEGMKSRYAASRSNCPR
jgi:hypothetical protein